MKKVKRLESTYGCNHYVLELTKDEAKLNDKDLIEAANKAGIAGVNLCFGGRVEGRRCGNNRPDVTYVHIAEYID